MTDSPPPAPAIPEQRVAGNIGSISDGYHTFDELYEHRHALFIALTREAPSISWRSRKHADGTMFDGWFIAGMQLGDLGQISYHIPNRLWGCLDHIRERQVAPEWDGHTSADVVRRLIEFKRHSADDCSDFPSCGCYGPCAKTIGATP